MGWETHWRRDVPGSISPLWQDGWDRLGARTVSGAFPVERYFTIVKLSETGAELWPVVSLAVITSS